jgi:hypothetical protein
LPASATPVTWHEHGLAGAHPFGPAQPAGGVGQAQHHAPLPLERPVADAAIDRADPGRVLVVDEQVVEPTVDHEGGGLAPADVVEDDPAAFHGAPP